jgi:hypothetical protein
MFPHSWKHGETLVGNNVSATMFPQQCFRNNVSATMFPQQCFRNNVSATMFPSLARALGFIL